MGKKIILTIKEANMTPIELVIIIVNYNQKQLTLNCLATVFKYQPQCKHKIILIDNNSIDGSVEIIRKSYPKLHIIENKKNLGLVKANNIGIKQSDSEFIIFLNNDTLIKPNCFDNLYNFIKSHPDAGIVGARMYYKDDTLQMSCLKFPSIKNAVYEALGLASLFPKSKIFGEFEMTWWDHEEIKEVDWCCGAGYIVRREAYDKVGNIDETYFVYAEDLDMCFQVRKAGYKVYYLPSAELIHLSGRNVTKVNYRKIMEQTGAWRYAIRKNYNVGYYLIYNSIKILGTIVKLIKWKIISFSSNPDIKKKAIGNTMNFYLSLKNHLKPLDRLHFSTIE